MKIHRIDEDEAFPSIEDCNDLVDWIEENNEIDLNCVRFRIRELDDGNRLIVICEWRFRARNDPPKASELLGMRGWVIEKWKWDGEKWSTCFWKC